MKVRITGYIEDNLVQKLDNMSRSSGLSRNYILTRILEKSLTENVGYAIEDAERVELLVPQVVAPAVKPPRVYRFECLDEYMECIKAELKNEEWYDVVVSMVDTCFKQCTDASFKFMKAWLGDSENHDLSEDEGEMVYGYVDICDFETKVYRNEEE